MREAAPSPPARPCPSRVRTGLEPVSSPPRYKVADDRMLDAAASVFAAEGFTSASMTTIAASAETTKPTLYARFGSKEELFGAAVEREYELLKKRLFSAYAAAAQAPFAERLRGWVGAYFDFARDRPAGFKLIAEGERHPAAAAIIERTRDDIIDRIAALIATVSGRPRARSARAVAAMISGLVSRCAQDAVARGLDLDDAARLCESFLYPALRSLDLDLMGAVDRRG